jgi:hypothetical protein
MVNVLADSIKMMDQVRFHVVRLAAGMVSL